MVKNTEEVDKNLKLLAKTSLIVFVGVALSKVLGYIYRIVVARYFGPEIYGIFSLALMVLGWFVVFSSLGLSEGVLRYISLYRGENKDKKIRYVFKFSLTILTISSITAGILLFFLSNIIAIKIFHAPDLILFLRLFSILVPLTVLFYPLLSTIRAFEKISSFSFIYNILQNIVKVAFLALFVLIGLNSNSIIYSYILGIFSMLIAGFYVCKYKIPGLFLKSNLKKQEKSEISKNLFSYSLPLLFYGAISSIFYWVDSFFLGVFKTAEQVGFYNAAIPIALLLGIVPELFAQLFFPLITKEYSRKKMDLIKELSQQLGKWIFILNLPVFILIILFPGAVINLLFGAEYLVASEALRILAIGALLNSLFSVSQQLLSMAGKTKLFLFNIILASLMNIVLNYIFIPMNKILFIENSLGINGAALATTISITFLNLLFIFQAKKYVSIVPVRRKMINIAVVSIIPILLLFYLRSKIPINLFTLGLLGSLFVLSYFVLILVTKGLDKNDIMILKTIKARIIKPI